MPRKPIAHPLLDDPLWLRTAYEFKTLAMIAAEVGCSAGAVRNRFIAFGIERRPKRSPQIAPHAPSDIERRFWDKVFATETCWIWAGLIARRYGVFWEVGRNVPAHRYSWELHNGPIPDGLFVCHHCDNPICVRPDHLFLGTPLDNMQDKMAKGRHRTGEGPRPLVQGERNPNARFTDAQVAEMRALYASGVSQHQIAARFGTKQPVVQRIVTGKARIAS